MTTPQSPLYAALEQAEAALWQCKNDLLYPPADEVVGQRLAMISEATRVVRRQLVNLDEQAR